MVEAELVIKKGMARGVWPEGWGTEGWGQRGMAGQRDSLSKGEVNSVHSLGWLDISMENSLFMDVVQPH